MTESYSGRGWQGWPGALAGYWTGTLGPAEARQDGRLVPGRGAVGLRESRSMAILDASGGPIVFRVRPVEQ